MQRASVPDSAWMKRALRLAERGWGRVQPNPMVGAVVIDADGRLAGQGHHAEFGGPHAEVNALNAAGVQARGGTLYVTLEPCNHVGKTPPCTDAILRAGIARVVFGAADPNPLAAGGAERLRGAGVQVTGPIAQDEVAQQNASFFHALRYQRPFVALKLATTLDARITESRGQRTLITGTYANEETQRLRAGYDAIMVGRGTVRADDPLLSVRGEVVPRQQPLRVVLDSEARLSVASRLAETTALGPVVVFCAEDADQNRRRLLERYDVRVVGVRRTTHGVDVDAVLRQLWREGVRSVFCEGGALVAGSLGRADLIDRLHLFVAPRIMGAGVGAFDAFTQGATPLRFKSCRNFGDDLLVTYDRAVDLAPDAPLLVAASDDVYRPR